MEVVKKKLNITKKKDVVERNHQDVAKALEILFATEYIDQKKLYLHNFLRGMAFSAGGVIGATLLIALLIWFLSLFDQVPLVGPFFENTRETIQQSDSSR